MVKPDVGTLDKFDNGFEFVVGHTETSWITLTFFNLIDHQYVVIREYFNIGMKRKLYVTIT